MKHRNHTISFRVSDKEFENLRSFCDSLGAHNVSELTRTALQKLVNGSEGPMESRIQAIEREIGRLNATLTQLTHPKQNGQ